MRSFFLSCFYLCTTVVFASDPKYPVSAIAADLKENADVVYRENTSVFTIHAQNKATHYVHQVATIFNAKGKNFAAEIIYYDKLRKVHNVSATVYDADGKYIKRLKDKDIEDHSAVGDQLFSDGRFKYFDLSQGTYPYTVELEYEVEYKFLFYIPTFAPVFSEKTSCEKASFSVKYPAALRPRFKTFNQVTKTEERKDADGLLSSNWTFQNVKPIDEEPQGPEIGELVPSIWAAPSNFEYDNYVGRMNTWDEYGKWISSLNKGRNVLPEATKAKAISLTKNAVSQEQKIRILYEYLQNKTRYVSIQLGIGGFQPFEASVVDQLGYGDCKALSMYMMSLLDAVSIKSHYALISAGYDADELDEDFPATQFNHVLLAVPNAKDTIWLECTNQANPFGYQGFHTGDRKALLITDTGAKIVRTKHYSAEENIQSRTAEVFIDAAGDGRAKIQTTYNGLKYESTGVENVLNAQGDEQKRWIHETTRIPTFDLVKGTFEGSKTRIPSAVVKLELGLRRYSTVSGKRMFLVPNLMNRSTFIPEKVSERKTAVVVKYSFTDVDTIQYRLPESLYPEVLPSPVKISSPFGEYESSFKLDQGSVIYTRKHKVIKGEFPAASYPEYIEFCKKINRADNIKIVFLSKT